MSPDPEVVRLWWVLVIRDVLFALVAVFMLIYSTLRDHNEYVIGAGIAVALAIPAMRFDERRKGKIQDGDGV